PQALPDSFAATARQDGLALTRTAGFPSVAFAHQHAQLLDVEATDAQYPLRGTLELADAAGRHRIGHGAPQGTVYLDHRALVALGLKVGDQLQLGGGELLALAPRAMMSLADAEAVGLLGTGSRARHRLLLAGSPADVQRWRDWA